MKSWKRFLILVLLASLFLSLAACGGDAEEPERETEREAEVEEGQDASEIDQPTQAPPEEPTQPAPEEPTEEAAPPATEGEVEGGEELELGFLSSTADFDSYRSLVTITVKGMEDGQEIEKSIDMLVECTTDPPAQHISISPGFFGEEMGIESIEMYMAERTIYGTMGGPWVAVPARDGAPYDTNEYMFSPDLHMEDSCGWEEQPDAEVLGVRVHHLAVDRAGLEACASAALLQHMGQVREFRADRYVAVDGGYMVQMDAYFEAEEMDLELWGGADEQLEEASLTIHWEYTDVNQPFTIELPEEALAARNFPDDIPMPPQASFVTNALGVIVMETTLSMQEAYDFYLAQLPANGWTEDITQQYGDQCMMLYSKEGRSASLMIAVDEDTGATTVMVTVIEE